MHSHPSYWVRGVRLSPADRRSWGARSAECHGLHSGQGSNAVSPALRHAHWSLTWPFRCVCAFSVFLWKSQLLVQGCISLSFFQQSFFRQHNIYTRSLFNYLIVTILYHHRRPLFLVLIVSMDTVGYFRAIKNHWYPCAEIMVDCWQAIKITRGSK